MQKPQDGSTINLKSEFSFKHLLTKPAHYIIQLFTDSKIFHQGIMCDGLIYEAMLAHGVRAIPLKQKVQEIDKDVISIHVDEPAKKLTAHQVNKLRQVLNKQIGKKFSISEAAFSAITAILRQKKAKSEKMFCSKLIIYSLGKVFPKKLGGYIARTKNPEEARKLLWKVGYLNKTYKLEI